MDPDPDVTANPESSQNFILERQLSPVGSESQSPAVSACVAENICQIAMNDTCQENCQFIYAFLECEEQDAISIATALI